MEYWFTQTKPEFMARNPLTGVNLITIINYINLERLMEKPNKEAIKILPGFREEKMADNLGKQ